MTPCELAYGAPADDLRAAIAPLRALASRHGVVLRPLADVDVVTQAAAIVAAHAWARATGRQLDAAGTGRDVAAALARVLYRSAGASSTPDRVDDSTWRVEPAAAAAAGRDIQDVCAALPVSAEQSRAAAFIAAYDLAGPGVPPARLAAWTSALLSMSGVTAGDSPR